LGSLAELEKLLDGLQVVSNVFTAMHNSSSTAVDTLKLHEQEANHDGRHVSTHALAHDSNEDEEYVGQEIEACLEEIVSSPAELIKQLSVVKILVQSQTELRSLYESSQVSRAFGCFSEVAAHFLFYLAIVSDDFTPTVLGVIVQHVETVYIEGDREKHQWLVVKGPDDFHSKVSTHL